MRRIRALTVVGLALLAAPRVAGSDAEKYTLELANLMAEGTADKVLERTAEPSFESLSADTNALAWLCARFEMSSWHLGLRQPAAATKLFAKGFALADTTRKAQPDDRNAKLAWAYAALAAWRCEVVRHGAPKHETARLALDALAADLESAPQGGVLSAFARGVADYAAVKPAEAGALFEKAGAAATALLASQSGTESLVVAAEVDFERARGYAAAKSAPPAQKALDAGLARLASAMAEKTPDPKIASAYTRLVSLARVNKWTIKSDYVTTPCLSSDRKLKVEVPRAGHWAGVSGSPNGTAGQILTATHYGIDGGAICTLAVAVYDRPKPIQFGAGGPSANSDEPKAVAEAAREGIPVVGHLLDVKGSKSARRVRLGPKAAEAWTIEVSGTNPD